MTHRCIKGLEWARPLADPPAPSRASNPTAALGLRYERKLAKAAKAQDAGWIAGGWLEFQDANGYGRCQPDMVRQWGRHLLVLEAKLTWTPTGHTQIDKLYRPVLELMTKRPVLGVQVTKSLTRDCPPDAVCYDMESAIKKALGGGPVVLLWLATKAKLLKVPE